MIDNSKWGQLARAVHTRDFDAAVAVLDILAATQPRWAVAVQAARRVTNPPAPLPDTAPFPLPVPGAPAGLPWKAEDEANG